MQRKRIQILTAKAELSFEGKVFLRTCKKYKIWKEQDLFFNKIKNNGAERGERTIILDCEDTSQCIF